MKIQFIWGPGGVGKTHLAIWKAYQADDATGLFTLDPSRRIFDLLDISKTESRKEVRLLERSFVVRALEASQLFQELSSKSAANAKVQVFYDQMAKGLQEFRDYLSLIQLSDEIQRSDFKTLIIDTPPLQEAFGLHRAMKNLQSFFSQSLVQLAVKGAQKGAQSTWLHSTMKRVFEINRVFIGKAAAEKLFDFLEWLSLHSTRFQKASDKLTDLVYSESTEHFFILSPETSKNQLRNIAQLSLAFKNISFLINRSVANEFIPEGEDSFSIELRTQKSLELDLIQKLKAEFPNAPIFQFPLQLMGEDTREELEKFIGSRTTRVSVLQET